jgi:hypothetical protein
VRRPDIVPQISIPEEEAVAALLRVKPTADMRRSGANLMKAKGKRAK